MLKTPVILATVSAMLLSGCDEPEATALWGTVGAGAVLASTVGPNKAAGAAAGALLGLAAVVSAAKAADPSYQAKATRIKLIPIAGGYGYVLDLPKKLQFSSGSSKISSSFSIRDLADFIDFHFANRGSVEIIGYTDSVEAGGKSRELSRQRAMSVAAALRQNGLWDRFKVNVYGRGAAEPIASNNTEEGRSRNRRVVIILRCDEPGCGHNKIP